MYIIDIERFMNQTIQFGYQSHFYCGKITDIDTRFHKEGGAVVEVFHTTDTSLDIVNYPSVVFSIEIMNFIKLDQRENYNWITEGF